MLRILDTVISANRVEKFLYNLEETVNHILDNNRTLTKNTLKKLTREVPSSIIDDIVVAVDGLLFFSTTKRKGKFLVITGIDKSGKETQCFNTVKSPGVRPIYEVLRERNYNVLKILLPSYDTRLGSLVEAYLGKGRLFTFDGELSNDIAWMLWSLDRAQHNKKLCTWLANSHKSVVITKRWLESNLVYQTANGIDIKRILRFERNIVKPDYTVILDIPVTVALNRAKGDRDTYEQPKLLQHVREIFLRVPSYYNYGEHYIIDASRSANTVNSDLIELLGKLGL